MVVTPCTTFCGSETADGYLDDEDDLSRYEGIASNKTEIDAFFIAGNRLQSRPKNNDQAVFHRNQVKEVTFVADLISYQDFGLVF